MGECAADEEDAAVMILTPVGGKLAHAVHMKGGRLGRAACGFKPKKSGECWTMPTHRICQKCLEASPPRVIKDLLAWRDRDDKIQFTEEPHARTQPPL